MTVLRPHVTTAWWDNVTPRFQRVTNIKKTGCRMSIKCTSVDIFRYRDTPITSLITKDTIGTLALLPRDGLEVRGR